MVKMIFSFAAAMVLAALMLAATPAKAFDFDVTPDGVEQVECSGSEATALDEAAPRAQAETAGAATASDEGVEPALRIVTVDTWQMPHKPSLNEPIASDHATVHLQPCLTSRTGFILSSPVEHRIRHRHDGRMAAHESKGKHRQRLTRRLS